MNCVYFCNVSFNYNLERFSERRRTWMKKEEDRGWGGGGRRKIKEHLTAQIDWLWRHEYLVPNTEIRRKIEATNERK